MSKVDKSIFSEWLEKIQQESWQLELLISGFAIFGLFQFKDYFEVLIPRLIDSADSTASNIIVFLTVIVFGFTIIFITNLLIHVFVRGLWIGAIGLRYVSGDIDYEQLNYSNKFDEYLKKRVPSFDHYIEKLEKFSSIIFSYTYLLFFILMSFFLFAFYTIFIGYVIVFLYNLLGGTDYSYEYLDDNTYAGTLISASTILHSVLAGIVAVDFIILSRLKRIKNKYFAIPYFWIYRYINLITLSFFWRPMLLNFLDNKFTRYLIVAAIPYIFFVIGFMPGIKIISSDYFPNFRILGNVSSTNTAEHLNSFHYGFYDEEIILHNDDASRTLNKVSIPSRKISNDLFEVFIKNHGTNDDLIEAQDPDIQKLRDKGMHTIFSRGNFRSDTLDQVIEKYSLLQDSVSNLFKIKGLSPEEVKVKKEERDLMIFALKDDRNKIVRNIKLENISRIKAAAKSSFTFKIDDTLIDHNKVECEFYIHPISQSEGLLCYFQVDSLDFGKHYFSLDLAQPLSSTNNFTKTESVNYLIPFIYHTTN